MKETDMAPIEAALKETFAGLHAVRRIELSLSTPTEWNDLFRPHRYRWKDGKLYQITYDLMEIGEPNEVLTEVAAFEPEWKDRLIPLEDLRAFMRPHMQNTLPPYKDKLEEERMAGYRKCLCDLMVMLGINTSSSKKERDLCNEIYSKKYT